MTLGRTRETDWSQIYRPLHLKDCILPERIRRLLETMTGRGVVDNLIFHGVYGVGKTSTANAICRKTDADVFVVNGSLDNSVDDLRHTIEPFACTCSITRGKKVVLVDEAEGLSREYQDGLRGFMERVSANCSFIFTTNHVDRLSPALHSRCLVLDFAFSSNEARKMKRDFAIRLNRILVEEGRDCEPTRIAHIIAARFPDFRQILKQVQVLCEGP